MGGNALKNTPTRRYSKEEYEVIYDKVMEGMIKLNKRVGAARDIQAYKTKESFGDMDILYTTWDETPLNVEEVKEVFSPNEIVRNTNVISFNCEELQVDLIHSKLYDYKYAHNYFAWNDLGNLIGRLAHQFGLKHGHKGLMFPIREADQVFAEITISMDHNKVLRFLDLDVDVYNAGFDTLEDIFKFVSKSKYFNPEFYKLENLNHVARIRDRKRSTYNLFLEYCETLENTFWKPEKDDTKYVEKVFDFFPEALPKYQETMRDVALLRYARTKFNGTIVGELTGLENKQLGMFMQHLRGLFWFDIHTIVHLPQALIEKKILEEFHNFKF